MAGEILSPAPLTLHREEGATGPFPPQRAGIPNQKQQSLRPQTQTPNTKLVTLNTERSTGGRGRRARPRNGRCSGRGHQTKNKNRCSQPQTKNTKLITLNTKLVTLNTERSTGGRGRRARPRCGRCSERGAESAFVGGLRRGPQPQTPTHGGSQYPCLAGEIRRVHRVKSQLRPSEEGST